jgi:hypothetical protein
LCNAGTPLLAVERGVVRLSSDPLGGTTLELVLPDGSFWYYAHLEGYALGIVDGSIVRTGTILGTCGSSGDATVPHLHFSRFSASGVAQDPMDALVRWLHRAERRAGTKRSKADRSPISTTITEETGSPGPGPASLVGLGTQRQAPLSPPGRSAAGPTLPIEAAMLVVTLFGIVGGRRHHPDGGVGGSGTPRRSHGEDDPPEEEDGPIR